MAAPLATHRAQIEAILTAWGMQADKAAITAEIMADADLRGIDSHGLSMLPPYELQLKDGRLHLNAEPVILKETPVSALVDAGGGLGYVPSVFAMRTAIAKAKSAGIGAVAVRNSAHHGALQWYVRMAADAGCIGIACTTTSNHCAAPTGGRAARMGPDPWTFAAPSADGNHFVLDMATTTVAQGRVRNRLNEGKPCPPGWVIAGDGTPSTDPAVGISGGTGFMASLGGTPEGASHKGYGIAMMVQILAAGLSGSLIAADPIRDKRPGSMDIGHFFMAIDPGMYRPAEEFFGVVQALGARMRATPPVDPARPVQVPGDPERIMAARRAKEGIPVGPGLLTKVREIAQRAGAPWLLEDAARPEAA
jgi:LDH2 family malate/lactate/ureidoglycolate dehydrogenase